MIRTALDANVIVAAHMEWHQDHERSSAAIGRARGSGRRLLLPIPALVEAFSVMTRLPRGHRVLPHQARDVLHASFASDAELVAQDGDAVWALLDRAVAKGVSGGGIHDADILSCAERAGATRLLTLNPADFERLGPTKVEIVVP